MPSSRAAPRRRRVINSSTAAHFSTVFRQNFPESVCEDTEALNSWFLDTCQTAIDMAALLKIRQQKTKSEPWLNETTHTARQECRRAEQEWINDKLQVSFLILRDCWRHYQSTVKEAKRKYFSDIVLLNCHQPCLLFKVINSALNAPQTEIESSPAMCENFLHYFTDKATSTRALISPPASDPSVFVSCSAVFDSFEPVTLPSVQEIVGQVLQVMLFRPDFLRRCFLLWGHLVSQLSIAVCPLEWSL